MAGFAERLFGGSRFIAWALAPALLSFAVCMPLWEDEWSARSIAFLVVIDATAVLTALALIAPRRFRWAGRTAAGIVFLVYVAYVGDRLVSWHRGARRGDREPSVATSLAGLLLIGLPALIYAVRGLRRDREPLLLPDDDPLIVESIRRARSTLGLLRELYPRYPHATDVKFAFATDTGGREHVWGVVEGFEGDTVRVRVSTPPVTHRGPLPSVLTVPLLELEDWQITLTDGTVRGGFSTRAMIEACEREGRAVPRRVRRARFIDADPPSPATLMRG